MKKNLTVLCYLIISNLLSGCATKPNYVAPLPSEPRAFVKFEYTSHYPISSGQIITFDGDFICGDHESPNSQKLFQRGIGNPLVADLNLEGTWILARKNFKLYGYAVTSYAVRCKIAGSFIPKDGNNYVVHLGQTGENRCNLEVLDAQTNALADGFTIIKCEENK